MSYAFILLRRILEASEFLFGELKVSPSPKGLVVPMVWK